MIRMTDTPIYDNLRLTVPCPDLTLTQAERDECREAGKRMVVRAMLRAYMDKARTNVTGRMVPSKIPLHFHRRGTLWPTDSTIASHKPTDPWSDKLGYTAEYETAIARRLDIDPPKELDS